MSFAEKTEVPIVRSKAEIEGMLTRYGADQFVSGWADNQTKIQFRAKDRYVRFSMTLPRPDEKRFTQDPRCAWRTRSEQAAQKSYDQELRRLWRALALVIKAKLEAVQSGITTFEDEFMAHIVMPDGKTVSEHARPMIESAYLSGKAVALLPAF